MLNGKVIEIPFILENSSESGSLNQHRVGYLKLDTVWCIPLHSNRHQTWNSRDQRKGAQKKWVQKTCTRRESTL